MSSYLQELFVIRFLTSLIGKIFVNARILFKKVRGMFSSKKEQNFSFSPLSPLDSAIEGNEQYLEALKWALENKESIHNIGITGVYGSGKSSLLRTFDKHYKNRNDEILNISLASFNEEDKEDAEILQKVELSILQQIFYGLKAENFPDSSFERIKPISRTYKVFFTFICALLFISTASLTNLELLNHLPILSALPSWAYLIIILLIVFVLLIPASIRPLHRIKLSSISLDEKKVELTSYNNNISSLNQNLEELIYYFEIAKYNIVVFEDLDRFEKTEIFIKLRELNLLLNNALNKKEIVFIYAVKDDIFKDNKEGNKENNKYKNEQNRVKFFDFIIPIIPVLDKANSEMQIKQKLEKAGIYNQREYKELNKTISIIAPHITTMRQVENIINELQIHCAVLKSSNIAAEQHPISLSKLLAMTVYKNIFPSDYQKLSSGDSNIDTVFTITKTNLIKNTKLRFEEELDKLKVSIDEIEAVAANNLAQIKMIYVYEYIKKIEEHSTFRTFDNGAKVISFKGMLQDENFNRLLDNTIRYNNGNNPHNIKFSDVEHDVDPEMSYSTKRDILKNKSSETIVELKIKKLKIKKEINKIKGLSFIDLIQSEGNLSTLKKSINNELLFDLLFGGCIQEDYTDYCSLFYPGELSAKDRKFLLNIRNKIRNDDGYELENVDSVINKIHLSDFNSNYIPNYQLVDHLIQNDENYPDQLEYLFSYLRNNTEDEIGFIHHMLEESRNIDICIPKFFHECPEIWDIIQRDSGLEDHIKDEYIGKILQYVDVSDIQNLDGLGALEHAINRKNSLLFNPSNDDEKIISILTELELVLSSEPQNKISNEIQDTIYENSLYILNVEMVRFILQSKLEDFDEQKFLSSNYTTILDSGLDYLIDYINENIETYLDKVYFQLEQVKHSESEDYLIELLNNEEISKTNKEKIINNSQTVIQDITTISDNEIAEILLQASLISPKWENLYNHYNGENDDSD